VGLRANDSDEEKCKTHACEHTCTHCVWKLVPVFRIIDNVM